MTGLYSKSYYTAASQALVTRGDFPASILIGDIDGLKQINDAHGYGGGTRSSGPRVGSSRRPSATPGQ